MPISFAYISACVTCRGATRNFGPYENHFGILQTLIKIFKCCQGQSVSARPIELSDPFLVVQYVSIMCKFKVGKTVAILSSVLSVSILCSAVLEDRPRTTGNKKEKETLRNTVAEQ